MIMQYMIQKIKKKNLDEVLMQLNNLRNKHQTIGNFYLVKNNLI